MGRRHILETIGSAVPGGSRVEFVTPRGSRTTTFAELWSLSWRAANAIPRDTPRGRVAGLLTPSAEMVACFVGSLRSGRDFVSLPLPARGQDPVGYVKQVQTIVELSGAGVLVVEAAYTYLLPSIPGSLPCPVVVAERVVETGAISPSRADPEPGELIQFSSGTTGTPKGVRLRGEAIAANVDASIDALQIGGSPEAFCSWVPLSHDMGLIGGLLCSWAGSTRTRPGYQYVCISPEIFLGRPRIWMEACAATGATITAAPTFGYHLVSRRLSRGRSLDLRSLRACVVGAEPITVETLTTFASAARLHGMREGAVCPAYGLAEATLAVSMVTPGESWTTRTVSVDGRSHEYVSCGRVLDCVTVDAPDESQGPGPIRLRGPALSCGYLPVRDAAADGWLDTGDLGVLSNGELVVTGRADDLLCVAGRNLYAWELERAASALPQVRAGGCAVVADGGGRYVALFEGQGMDRGDLEGACGEVRKTLAGVAGIGPSGVGCLPRGALPKTPSGKLRRHGIAADLNRFVESCLAYREF